MYWFIGIVLVISLIISLILISKVKVSISYTHNRGKDTGIVEAYLWKGLLHYSWQFPDMNVRDESEIKQFNPTQRDKSVHAQSLINQAQTIKEMFDSIFQIGKITRSFLRSVTVEDFEWISTIGTGDAASTGIFSGMLWTIKGSIVGVFSHTVNLIDSPVFHVISSFQEPRVDTRLKCMFSFRIGKAMLAAIRIAKNWKGRKRHVRTSHSGFDANSDGKY